MNLMNLVGLLEAQQVGQRAKSIFLNMMPPETKRAVLLRSPLTGTKIDHELPGYFKTKFQIIVRTDDYEKGDALIGKAVKALTIKYPQQVGDMLVRYSRPCHQPVSFPLSAGGLIEFTVSMEIVFNEAED